jgi:hypothetical protein
MSPREELLALVRERLASHEREADGYVPYLRALEVLARSSKLGPGHLPVNQAERWQVALRFLRGEQAADAQAHHELRRRAEAAEAGKREAEERRAEAVAMCEQLRRQLVQMEDRVEGPGWS